MECKKGEESQAVFLFVGAQTVGVSVHMSASLCGCVSVLLCFHKSYLHSTWAAHESFFLCESSSFSRIAFAARSDNFIHVRFERK